MAFVEAACSLARPCRPPVVVSRKPSGVAVPAQAGTAQRQRVPTQEPAQENPSSTPAVSFPGQLCRVSRRKRFSCTGKSPPRFVAALPATYRPAPERRTLARSHASEPLFLGAPPFNSSPSCSRSIAGQQRSTCSRSVLGAAALGAGFASLLHQPPRDTLLPF